MVIETTKQPNAYLLVNTHTGLQDGFYNNKDQAIEVFEYLQTLKKGFPENWVLTQVLAKSETRYITDNVFYATANKEIQ